MHRKTLLERIITKPENAYEQPLIVQNHCMKQ